MARYAGVTQWQVRQVWQAADVTPHRLKTFTLSHDPQTAVRTRPQAIRDVLAAHPRFHLHFTPTSASWLNAVETWFGQLERRALRGAEALWGRQTMAGLASGGVASGNRLDGEVGYGLPVGRRFVGTPRVGVSTSEHGRDYRIGYGLGVSRAANVESG